MVFDLAGADAPLAYKLLASLVIPRPIALVTTVDQEGRVNAAPFSFFNVLGSEPPIVGVCPGDRDDGTPKDTARNIRTTGAFVVNLVDEPLAHAMSDCSASLPPGTSELEHAGLTAIPADTVRPPRIAEAPVSLECTEWGTLRIGANRLVIGLVKRLHVREGILDPESLRLRHDAYSAVGRMFGADGYCRTRDVFRIPRPD
jgi:flavin reductase (DIM6/NTAB) family NADH-FMN oxidoreductase RutF